MNQGTAQAPSDLRGIDLGGVVIMCAHNKIVISPKASARHLTLHFGPRSREMDLHRTEQAAGGESTHERLFAITHTNFETLMREIAPTLVARLAGISRPLRPGWMIRNQIVAVVGMLPSEADWPRVTGVRKKRLFVDAEKLKANGRALDFPDELYDLPDSEGFSLFSCERAGATRAVGFGLKCTDELGRPRLIWVKNRDVGQAFRRIEDIFAQAARKYGTVLVEPPWL